MTRRRRSRGSPSSPRRRRRRRPRSGRPRRSRAVAPRRAPRRSVAPASIRVRMKFVVPLTIPSTRWTFVTTSDSRSTLITGIAAQTEPRSGAARPPRLLRRRARCCAARAAACSRSPPACPARRSSRTWSPVGVRPPITSATTAIEASSRISAKSVVSTPSSRLELALLVGVAHERAHEPEPMPGRALDVVCAVGQQPRYRAADRPVAEEGDRNVNRHSALRSAACASSAT